MHVRGTRIQNIQPDPLLVAGLVLTHSLMHPFPEGIFTEYVLSAKHYSRPLRYRSDQRSPELPSCIGDKKQTIHAESHLLSTLGGPKS